MQGKALWYVGPGRAELREEKIAASKPGEVRVRALFGAISRGATAERAGRVPASEYDRMRAPFMGGTFPSCEVRLATVGQVEAGPANFRAALFQPASPQSLSPFRSTPCLRSQQRCRRRAVLAPNMETASTGSGTAPLARPIASPSWVGARRSLVAYLCRRLPGPR